ncbi:hypothetical protein ACU4GA_25375 [Methylobacterium oryzae CBMB20]
MPDTARLLDGRRILIVEDEYLIAMQVKRWPASRRCRGGRAGTKCGAGPRPD